MPRISRRVIPWLSVAMGWAVASAAQPVPSSLIAKSALRPIDFVYALSDASVPAGIEVREGDDTPSMKPEYEDGGSSVDLADVVRAFNRQHRTYGAQITNGVVVVRPTELRAAFLDQTVTIPAGTVNGLLAAERRLFGLTGPFTGGGGIAGNYESGDWDTVSFDGRSRTVIEVMNLIVRSSFYQSWLVLTKQDAQSSKVVAFGLVHAGGAGSLQGCRRGPADDFCER